MGLKVGYVALNQVDDDRYQYRIYSMQSTKHITLPLNQVDDNKYQYMNNAKHIRYITVFHISNFR